MLNDLFFSIASILVLTALILFYFLYIQPHQDAKNKRRQNLQSWASIDEIIAKSIQDTTYQDADSIDWDC